MLAAMQMTLSDRQVSLFRLICIAILFAAAGCYVIFTIHWPWMWDRISSTTSSSCPAWQIAYKDIYDMNMPGCYLMERWAIDIFGGGNLGWRFYEFTLLGSMTLAACVIALPYDWVAGLAAGVLFAIFHGVDLATMATERDEVMAVFLLVGYAFLFLAVRRSRAILMLPFGLALGMAMLIKPTAAAVRPGTTPVRVFCAEAACPAARRLTFSMALPVSASSWPSCSVFFCPIHSALSFFSSAGAFRTTPASRPLTWGYLLRNSLPVPFFFFLPAAILLADREPGPRELGDLGGSRRRGPGRALLLRPAQGVHLPSLSFHGLRSALVRHRMRHRHQGERDGCATSACWASPSR